MNVLSVDVPTYSEKKMKLTKENVRMVIKNMGHGDIQSEVDVNKALHELFGDKLLTAEEVFDEEIEKEASNTT